MATGYRNTSRPVVGAGLTRSIPGAKPIKPYKPPQLMPVKQLPIQTPKPISTTGLSTSTGSSMHPFGTPVAPTAQQTAPTNSATSQAVGSVPLDSTYFANVAANQFKVNNQVGGLRQQGGYALTDLQNALANLAYQQPRDQLKTEQAANQRGALYSTVYNQNLADLTRAYGLKQSGLQQGYQRSEAARQAQIAALLAGEPIYESQQAAQAAERASQAAANNPSGGEPTRPLTPTPAPAAAPRAVAFPAVKNLAAKLAKVKVPAPKAKGQTFRWGNTKARL